MRAMRAMTDETRCADEVDQITVSRIARGPDEIGPAWRSVSPSQVERLSHAVALVRSGGRGGGRKIRFRGDQQRRRHPCLLDAPARAGSRPGAPWWRQHFGQDPRLGRRRQPCRGPLRQGQRLGHGDYRARRPAGGAVAAAASAGEIRRALGRRHGQAGAAPSHGPFRAEPVGRGDPARQPAFQARRSHPRQRHRFADQPAARRGADPRSVPRRDLRALRDAGFPSR